MKFCTLPGKSITALPRPTSTVFAIRKPIIESAVTTQRLRNETATVKGWSTALPPRRTFRDLFPHRFISSPSEYLSLLSLHSSRRCRTYRKVRVRSGSSTRPLEFCRMSFQYTRRPHRRRYFRRRYNLCSCSSLAAYSHSASVGNTVAGNSS